MSALVDLTGQRYGRLVVVCRADVDGNESYWLCRCDCGGETIRRGIHIRTRGTSQSCGCVKYHRAYKYALLVDGEYITVKQLAAKYEIKPTVLYKAAKRGELSLEWIKQWTHRRWLLSEARRLGISSDALHHRRKLWGESDAVYLTPKGVRRTG